jgi:hypothetical protein
MSTYAEFYVQDRSTLVNWILRKLGYPLIQVEVNEDQIAECINDALETFSMWVTPDEAYMVFDLQDSYEEGLGIKVPTEVVSVFSIDGRVARGGINTLFSIENQMWNMGMFPTIGSGGWINYEMANQAIKLTHMMTGGGFQYNYNERSKYLTLYPDPAKGELQGKIIIGVGIIRPEEQLLGEYFVKNLALSYVMQVLGRIRKKFTGVTLLAGGQIDETIGDEGKELEDKLMEELPEKYPVSDFIIG